RSVSATAATLGGDAESYAQLMEPLLRQSGQLIPELLSPPIRLPRHPLPLLRFARHGLQSAEGFIRRQFRESRARGFFIGIAAHSSMRLDTQPTAAFGLMLG